MFLLITIFCIFGLTQEKEEMWQGFICKPSFKSVLVFAYCHGNHFQDFLAHALSWVKCYNHGTFQRNSFTGLARMMVQTDRQAGSE